MKRLTAVLDRIPPVGRRRPPLWLGQLVAGSAVAAAVGLYLATRSFSPYGASGLLILAMVTTAGSSGAAATLTAGVLSIAAAVWIGAGLGATPGHLAWEAVLLAALAGTLAVCSRRLFATLESLDAREVLMQALLDISPDGVVLIDEAGSIQGVNPAAERIFQRKADDIRGQNVSTLMPAPHRDAHNGYIERYLFSRRPRAIGHTTEVEGLKADGSIFPIDVHLGEILLGGRRYFAGFVRDLSALREAERRSGELRGELVNAFRLNSLGQMAAVLAHELNQPLSAITNYLRAARSLSARAEDQLDPELIDALDRAGDQALRAGEMIRSVRSFVTRNEIDPRPESLRALIKDLLEVMAGPLRDAKITVEYDLGTGADTILAERIQVQQLLGNLIRNAIDAVKTASQPRIRVSMRQVGDELIVNVEDNGPGIAPEIAERLFEPLATNKPQGLGLGLSISRSIVERHGGRIWTDVANLGGAAFSFSLPAAAGGEHTIAEPDGIRHRR